MIRQCVVDLFNPAIPHAFDDQAEVMLPLDSVEGMDEVEVQKLIKNEAIPIFVEWPVRHFPNPTTRYGNGKLYGVVLDLYRRLKPKQIGILGNPSVVKVNGSYKLHGTIHYYAGRGIDATRISSLRVVLMSCSLGFEEHPDDRVPMMFYKVIATPIEQVIGY